MECSSYDWHFNEDAVVAQVERLRAERDAANGEPHADRCAQSKRLKALLEKAEAEVERLRAQQAEQAQHREQFNVNPRPAYSPPKPPSPPPPAPSKQACSYGCQCEKHYIAPPVLVREGVHEIKGERWLFTRLGTAADIENDKFA
jgi:hypothetical protein